MKIRTLYFPFIFLVSNAVFAQPHLGSKPSIKQLSAGSNHSLALLNNGSLWAWGNNAAGQLGDSSTTDQDHPVWIRQETNWASATAGDGFNHAIKTDGTLWGWGINKIGQLGIPTNNLKYMYTVPVQIGNDHDWQMVSSGNYFTVGLKKDGTIWVWGADISYLLSDKTHQYEPIKINDKNNNDFKDIATGDEFFMAMKKDGTIWTMGTINEQNNKQLVKVNDDTDWAMMDAGRQHAAAIKNDGTLWTWGANESGQLGNGTTNKSKEPVRVGENFAAVGAANNYTAAVKKFEGDVFWWGKNWMNKTSQLLPIHAQVTTSYAPFATGHNSMLLLMDSTGILEFCKYDKYFTLKRIK